MVAQLIAHRAVGNQEQDADNGKLAGYCLVCQIPWPCEYAKPVQHVDSWILVSERLPEPYQEIWVTFINGEVEDRIEAQNIVLSNPKYGGIAWMPRTTPKPYQSGGV